MKHSVESAGRSGEALLSEPRWELIPLKSANRQIERLPPHSKVTVTCSPARGIDATLDLVESLVRAGHQAVPHLAARMVESEPELKRLLNRLDGLGVTEAFVVGGDQRESLGPYPDSHSLLSALRALGSSLKQIGVAGYPEGHPSIPREVLLADLKRKLDLADYVVTQMCFDGNAIRAWLEELRRNGIGLPVYAGVPGAVDFAKLAEIGAAIGVGTSLRFLKNNLGTVRRLMAGYDPTALVDELGGMKVAGVHIYTFNRVDKTEGWRRAVLSRTSST